ncbi:hypothetical protein BDK51DRAFT_50262 [Blyttiomyces helicus]|uniref:Uncharacterized protein n=1 Tax=Blyttiomyces helicus TaxID=388810 RepID=A0A4P9W5Y7_9FUNG|nr:hypothetical protein BDK51DRAFT_50262 [Blyttiomyces helicus]|eukprot:RKO87849.1 hypothetical protein BDK51DRAFT_50262 [Blyttiomyces helicus]
MSTPKDVQKSKSSSFKTPKKQLAAKSATSSPAAGSLLKFFDRKGKDPEKPIDPPPETPTRPFSPQPADKPFVSPFANAPGYQFVNTTGSTSKAGSTSKSASRAASASGSKSDAASGSASGSGSGSASGSAVDAVMEDAVIEGKFIIYLHPCVALIHAPPLTVHGMAVTDQDIPVTATVAEPVDVVMEDAVTEGKFIADPVQDPRAISLSDSSKSSDDRTEAGTRMEATPIKKANGGERGTDCKSSFSYLLDANDSNPTYTRHLDHAPNSKQVQTRCLAY